MTQGYQLEQLLSLWLLKPFCHNVKDSGKGSNVPNLEESEEEEGEKPPPYAESIWSSNI